MLTRRQLITSGAGALLAAPLTSAAQEATELQINSARYIATNADTGAIFAQRGANDQVAIASLTKIFTAIEAVNKAPLDFQITTTEDDMQSAEATVMGFGPGETFTLEDLLYGMLLPSGNDAAHAIARSLGGQEGDSAEEAVQRFVDMMNERVALMGLNNTNLKNADGWGVPDHYSSAADVAAFMAYASQHEFVLDVLGAARYTTTGGYNLTNSNKVLTSSPSVLGGKTGYDWDSGWCLVQIAERQNTRIVAVTLDGVAPDDWYNDNLVLLDYGFEQQNALGSDTYDGEFVSWTDPAPLIFAQAGPAVASITGESGSGEQVVTTEEAEIANVPQRIAPAGSPARLQSDSEGLGRGAVLSGIGGAALATGMALTRWMDFGGDRTAVTVQPSLAAAAGSFRRATRILPSRSRQTATEPHSDLTNLTPADGSGTNRHVDGGTTRLDELS